MNNNENIKNILAIDSSTNILKLALAFGGDRMVKSEEEVEQSHGQIIIKKIEALFQSAGVDKTDLDALIVSTGPGSFTGLRIGIAAAKGIAVALDKKIFAVNLFELAAFKLSETAETVQVIIPFKKDRFFVVPVMNGGYDLDVLSTVDMNQLEKICSQTRFAAFGISLSSMFPDCFQNDYSENIQYSATDLIYTAKQKIDRGEFEDSANLEPLYIQKSQAEINFERRNKN